MDDQFFYVVTGEPLPVSAHRPNKQQRIFDTRAQNRLHWGMQLADQHDGKPPFTGPIQLDVFFYMTPPNYPAAKKKGLVAGHPHFFIPKITHLLEFLEIAATGVLWNDSCIIAEVHHKKIYDDNPRTEMFITKLKR